MSIRLRMWLAIATLFGVILVAFAVGAQIAPKDGCAHREPKDPHAA